MHVFGASTHFCCFRWSAYKFLEKEALKILRELYSGLKPGEERDAVCEAGKILSTHERQWRRIRDDANRAATSMYAVVHAVEALRSALGTLPGDKQLERLLSAHSRSWRRDRCGAASKTDAKEQAPIPCDSA